MLLDIFRLDVIASLASENDELAYDIHAGEVDARVGFGIPLLSRTADGLGEGHVGGELVEYEVQRA